MKTAVRRLLLGALFAFAAAFLMDDTARAQTGCTGPDPFAVLGGGTCYRGGWLPPGLLPPNPNPVPSPTPVTCTTSDPFVSLGGGTCFNGGWLPPGLPPPSSAGGSGSI